VREPPRAGATTARAEGEANGLRVGREKGLREGEARGTADGLRQAALALCDVLGIELSFERLAQLETMMVDELEALCQVLRMRQGWPQDRADQ
jgi:flagellar biosynthesis/type III secretory pathway protein FliH